ncbi:CD151 antigen-like isoform X2 [Stegodyphus dumicola]|uniref:CD151 antigen-like isoform X2 n=1 Tax=Stegodyphus dumicola TaxID=202533 RepID=UPI0015B03942|nr:CD151 antigen-like isoform X2 [Stegodyphus dumicola]
MHRIMESSKEELSEAKEKFISLDEAKRLSLENSVRHHARMQAIICLILWISGLMTYSISEWYHSDPTQEPLLSMPRHQSTVYLSHCGIVICLTGYYGFWAALRQVHSMIFAFSYIVFITSVAEICGGAVILSYLEQPVRDNALRIIVNQTRAFSMENPRIFRLQITLQCCGADFPGDWVGSTWWLQQREKNTSFVVPPSCCLTGSVIRQKELSCNKGQPPYEEVLDSRLIHQKWPALLYSDDFLSHFRY